MTKRSNETPEHASARIAAYRRRELALEAGFASGRNWIEYRRRIVELAQNLKRVQPLLLVESIEDDELETVRYEASAMRDMADKVVRLIEERMVGDV